MRLMLEAKLGGNQIFSVIFTNNSKQSFINFAVSTGAVEHPN